MMNDLPVFLLYHAQEERTLHRFLIQIHTFMPACQHTSGRTCITDLIECDLLVLIVSVVSDGIIV